MCVELANSVYTNLFIYCWMHGRKLPQHSSKYSWLIFQQGAALNLVTSRSNSIVTSLCSKLVILCFFRLKRWLKSYLHFNVLLPMSASLFIYIVTLILPSELQFAHALYLRSFINTSAFRALQEAKLLCVCVYVMLCVCVEGGDWSHFTTHPLGIKILPVCSHWFCSWSGYMDHLKYYPCSI